jgi:hypothetical protein
MSEVMSANSISDMLWAESPKLSLGLIILDHLLGLELETAAVYCSSHDPSRNCTICSLIRLKQFFLHHKDFPTVVALLKVLENSIAILGVDLNCCDPIDVCQAVANLIHSDYAVAAKIAGTVEEENVCGCPVHTSLVWKFYDIYQCSRCGNDFERTPKFYYAFSIGTYSEVEEERIGEDDDEVSASFKYLNKFVEYFRDQLCEARQGECKNCGEICWRYEKFENMPEYMIVKFIKENDDVVGIKENYEMLKMKELKILVSLNHSFHASELNVDENAYYNLIGLLIKRNNKFKYIAFMSESFFRFSGPKSRKPCNFNTLLFEIAEKNALLIGIIYKKSQNPLSFSISQEVTKQCEIVIHNYSKCLNCKLPLKSYVCQHCSFSHQAYELGWVCLTCSFRNPNRTLACHHCNNRRFPYPNAICSLCDTVSVEFTCTEHTTDRCKLCKKQIFFCQAYFCSKCGVRKYKNSTKKPCLKFCGTCKEKPNDAESICFACAMQRWACPMLGKKCVSAAFSRTKKCGFANNANNTC